MTSELTIEYDEEFDKYVVDSEWNTNRSTSEVVVHAVGEVASEDPTSLRPLAEVVDPDALDSLFDHMGDHQSTNTYVVFEYHDYEITVFGNGRITLAE